MVAAAWYLVELAVFQTQRAELATPYAAAVQSGEPLVEFEPERRPMAAEQGRVLLRPQIKPVLSTGEDVMATGLMKRCARGGPQLTTRDQWLAGIAMIVATLVMGIVSLVFLNDPEVRRYYRG